MSRRASGALIGTVAALDSILRRAGMSVDAATNAGIFAPDGRPLGLLIQQGRTYEPLNLSAGPPGNDNCAKANFYCQPEGVFVVTSGGAQVLDVADYHPGIAAHEATQSGPLLLHRGKMARAFSATSTSRHKRNAVCTTHGGDVKLVFADSVSLFEFAQGLHDTFACRDALYLDGGISTLYPSKPMPEESYGGFIVIVSRRP